MNKPLNNSTLNEVFKKLKEFLEKDPNIVFAIVFGSAVRGKLRKDSDIDVAIYVKNELEPLKYLELMSKLSDLVKREVHLVILNSASPLLRHQVMKEREILFIKDFDTYAKFREKTMTDYDEYLYISDNYKLVEKW